MTTRLHEIVDGIYRISQWNGESTITFNQFLIADERPTLVHTGRYGDYEGVRSAISRVLDPATLQFVVLLHFEADECGGMDRFLADSPAAELVGSSLSIMINAKGFGVHNRVRGFTDGETLELGRHTLRFLETPHVHHWDSLMLFDETTRSLFPADLFMQGGDQPPVVTEDLGSEMCAMYRSLGIFAHEKPVRRVVDRIEGLQPGWVHAMHGGSLTRDALPDYIRALREEEFAFDGRLLGRRLEGNLG